MSTRSFRVCAETEADSIPGSLVMSWVAGDVVTSRVMYATSMRCWRSSDGTSMPNSSMF